MGRRFRGDNIIGALSHLLVSTVVVDERRTARSGAHGFDRAEENIVAANRPHFDDAAVERDHGGDQDRTAGRKRQPVAGCEPIPANNPGTSSKMSAIAAPPCPS